MCCRVVVAAVVVVVYRGSSEGGCGVAAEMRTFYKRMFKMTLYQRT